jgi:hypothetical protein
LQRRGLALDQARLLDYLVHEAWLDKMFNLLLRPALPGYHATSMDQLMRADQQLFRVMANLTRGGIIPRPDGSYPLNEAIKQAMEDPSVCFLLLPLPAVNKRAAEGTLETQKYARQATKGASSSSSTGRPLRPAAAPRRSARGRGSQGGKGSTAAMPPALKGMHSRTDTNESICWNYNLPNGCGNASDGSKCSKGKHVCCRPGCYGPHPLARCPGAH